jgi:hypothetical protein
MHRTLVLAAALVAAAPAVAADPPIVFQTQPVGRLLDDARTVVGMVAGDKEVKAFNDGLRQTFGEKGLEGLDLTRPVLGYCVLAPKLTESATVVLLPIGTEQEFLDLCERANRQKPKPLGGGLYELPPADFADKAMMRIQDGHAYLCSANDPAPYLDPKALVPAAKLLDPNERALACGRVYPDRLPKEVKAQLGEQLAQFKKMLSEPPPGVGAQEWNILRVPAEQLSKLADRCFALSDHVKDVAVRLNLDPASADMSAELTLTPNGGSPLAALLAARTPTANRFAGLFTPDTVAGFKTRLPLFNDELRASAAAGLQAAKVEAGRAAKPAGKAAAEALFDGLIRVAKTGEGDLAVAVRGPGKDGQFTGVAAVSFEDGAALDKAFRKLVEDDPPPGPEKIQWDAEKVGGVGIHSYKMTGGGFLNPADLFGKDKCVIAFAFGPKGLYAVLGTDAVGTLKDVLAAKPGPSPVLDMVVNPARLAKMVAAVGDEAGGLKVEAALGKEDKLRSAASLAVAGGKDLKVTFTLNAKVFPRLLGSKAQATFEPVDPPPLKK